MTDALQEVIFLLISPNISALNFILQGTVKVFIGFFNGFTITISDYLQY